MSKHFETIKQTWKKQAAAMMGAPGMTESDISNMEIERAFMQQAYNKIEGKAGPLLKDQFRLGFEVVYKNEDSSKMVGIFAFKVNAELLFIPVFFTASDIRGTELLYRSKTKTFVPLSEDWCKYTVSSIQQSIGNLAEKPNLRQDALNIEKIIFPPNYAKRAFVEMAEKLMFDDEQENHVKLASYLEDQTLDQTKYIQHKIASDETFAEAMFVAYENMTDWLPRKYKKSASSKKPALELVFQEANCKDSELDEFYKQGYFIRDNRQPSTVVKSAGTMCDFKEGLDYGFNMVYDVSANEVPILFAKEEGAYEDYPTTNSDCDDCRGIAYSLKDKSLVNFTNPKSSIVCSNAHYEVEDELKKKSVGKLEVNKGFLIVQKDNMLAKKLFVLSQNSESSAKVQSFNCYGYPCGNDDIKPMGFSVVISSVPHAETDSKHNVYKADDIWIFPLDVDRFNSFKNMSVTSFTNSYLSSINKNASSHTEKVEVSYDDVDYSFKSANKTLNGLSEAAFTLALCKECNLHKEAALDILELVQQERKTNFVVEKKATSLEFRSFPDMDDTESYDSIYDVMRQDMPNVEVVEAEGNYEEPLTLEELLEQEKKIEQVSTIAGMKPMEIAEISERTGIKSIFDHGVIASLTNTFDTRGLIENYMPDFDTALDKLGRLVFLFYWKPADFLEMYGSDDQNSIENMLISNFTAFGDMILELKQKNKEENRSIRMDKHPLTL